MVIVTPTKSAPPKTEHQENGQGDAGITPQKLLQNFFRSFSSAEKSTAPGEPESHATQTAGPRSIDQQRANRALRALRREQKKNNAQRKSIAVKKTDSDTSVGKENREMAQTMKQPPRSSVRLSYVPNAATPNTKQVKSKVGSLQYINHTPKGGNVKIPTHKIKINTSSKVGSLDNVKHVPGGGNLRIVDKMQEDKSRLNQTTSKCGSLKNIRHVPQGGNVKIVNQKINLNAKSKCGSLDNARYKPRKSDVIIENRKQNLTNVGSKIGSLDNARHRPKGGNIKIFNQKIDYGKVSSKTGSLVNINHKPGGGDIIVYDEHNASTRALAEQLTKSMVLEDDVQEHEEE